MGVSHTAQQVAFKIHLIIYPLQHNFSVLLSLLASQADAGGLIKELMSRNRMGDGRHIYPLLEV